MDLGCRRTVLTLFKALMSYHYRAALFSHMEKAGFLITWLILFNCLKELMLFYDRYDNVDASFVSSLVVIFERRNNLVVWPSFILSIAD